MSEYTYTIWAIKGSRDDSGKWDLEQNRELRASLKKGTARFGWSYIPSDLRKLQKKIDSKSWDSLTEDEQYCYQPFLLNEVKPGDWWVYINVPEPNKCCAARVTSPYKWLGEYKDFNHSVEVDPKSFFEFDRNDAAVPPYLRARLMLQGRKWRINAHGDFEKLRESARHNGLGTPFDEKSEAASLVLELRPLLAQITSLVQRNYPHRRLELLSGEILKAIPRARVTHVGGASDHGTDIIVEYDDWLVTEGLQPPRKCLVQVKSYEGEHWDTRAVQDLERAFERYPDADTGLIISTADKSTPQLEAALDKLRDKLGKPLGLLIGPSLARFMLRYGLDRILPSSEPA